MIFKDYQETGRIYHIISIHDLENILLHGIQFDGKLSYHTRYYEFHGMIDALKPEWVPSWVVRSKAIFGSLNYPDDHKFHSHTAILAIKIHPEKCWIANENYANQIYEPFVLQNLKEYAPCVQYLQTEGRELLLKYWNTSHSFTENLIHRYDQEERYDAEVLILHDIAPEDIELKYIISDHRMMNINAWKARFCCCR
ncbi:hypothetical protein [Geosporobacter ferrireducens]|uniref:hypothetical protein n=1 Tax=Geosporobacter ferrireducens TaxID=1424294 RepID=UPI00139DCB3C|nr:hypothetical protein [Geosporobacter ferrireducens]MTI54495.1 hypothetical protein [Geosporobacter ferrireducens]